MEVTRKEAQVIANMATSRLTANLRSIEHEPLNHQTRVALKEENEVLRTLQSKCTLHYVTGK